MTNTFTLGLCQKRHDIKAVDTYIFNDGDIKSKNASNNSSEKILRPWY